MADPQTSAGLYLPTRGSNAGVWDLPVNADTSAVDSLFANIAAISLTNAPVTLTTPPNSGAAWAGPYQSQSGILKCTGTLSADCTITIPRAGFFIVQNSCTVGSHAVILSSSAPGKVIGIPPGEANHIFCDGTDVSFVNLGRINAYEDWALSTIPRWVTVCTVPPYLNCDGSAFSAVTYPNTSAYLGGTTLPDSRGRARFALNQTTGRITLSSGVGIDGNTLIAGGGNETFVQGNFPAGTSPVTIPAGQASHAHQQNGGAASVNVTSAGGTLVASFNNSTTFPATLPAMSGTADLGGSGLPVLPPGFAAGLTVIRAG